MQQHLASKSCKPTTTKISSTLAVAAAILSTTYASPLADVNFATTNIARRSGGDAKISITLFAWPVKDKCVGSNIGEKLREACSCSENTSCSVKCYAEDHANYLQWSLRPSISRMVPTMSLSTLPRTAKRTTSGAIGKAIRWIVVS